MTDVKITGRSRETAILLLAAADELGLDRSVVRTTTNGYLVPLEVADKVSSSEEPEEKAPAKKAAAKKTTAKQAAPKKATQE